MEIKSLRNIWALPGEEHFIALHARKSIMIDYPLKNACSGQYFIFEPGILISIPCIYFLSLLSLQLNQFLFLILNQS